MFDKNRELKKKSAEYEQRESLVADLIEAAKGTMCCGNGKCPLCKALTALQQTDKGEQDE